MLPGFRCLLVELATEEKTYDTGRCSGYTNAGVFDVLFFILDSCFLQCSVCVDSCYNTKDNLL